MYSGSYGGFSNANGAPPPQNTHLQQPSQPGQVPHNPAMMYNPQQYPKGAQGGGFPGGPNMMPGAGPAGGMMQNTRMPMAAVNGQMPNYQASYSSSPYGAAIPSSLTPQMNLPPNYAMGGSMPMSGFPMHPGQMTPQQQQQMMQQRMQPPQSNAGGMPASTPQRPFLGHGQGPGSQGTPTPNNALPSHQSQFPTSQQHAQGTPQGQIPNHAHQQPQQPLSANSQTPQTPTFPSNVHIGVNNGTSSSSTPLSPGGDTKDKEKVTLILEINNELLIEAMQIQHTQSVLKKEHASPQSGNANEAEKKTTEDEEVLAQEYLHCMRRLQTNLGYLASLADKKNSVQAAPCPAYLKAPPINTNVKLRQMPVQDGTEAHSAPMDREETVKYLQDLYTKLQGLYPGIDPNKEPTFPISGVRPGAVGSMAGKPGSQTPSQASPIPGNTQTPQMPMSMPLQLQMGPAAATATP